MTNELNTNSLEETLEQCFISQNVNDSNFEPANLVDVVNRLADKTASIAEAIYPSGVVAGADAAGGHVWSLTEAVMGMTAGLCRIAEAIESLASAVGRKND